MKGQHAIWQSNPLLRAEGTHPKRYEGEFPSKSPSFCEIKKVLKNSLKLIFVDSVIFAFTLHCFTQMSNKSSPLLLFLGYSAAFSSFKYSININ